MIKGNARSPALGEKITLRHQYMLMTGQLGSKSAEKDIRVLLDSKLTMNKKCLIRAKKANNILGSIRQIIARRLREVILALW